MRTVVTVWTSTTLLAFTLAAGGDRPGTFGGETTVNVIEVPVSLVDPATGEPITGLGPDDFVVLENGRVQQLTNFLEVSRPRPGSPGSGPEAAVPGALARPLGVVYFLDLYLMYPQDRDRAVEALHQRYRGGIPTGEEVSVIVFDGELKTLVDRTRWRDELLEALELAGGITAKGVQQAVSFTDSLVSGEVSGERRLDFYERRQRSREFVADLEKRSRRVGDAVATAMARQGRTDGRRVLVAFTPGHPRTEWSPSYAPVDFVNAATEYPTGDLWQSLAHEAADLGFTLYTVDSSGFRSDSSRSAERGVTDVLDEGLRRGLVLGPRTGASRQDPVARDSPVESALDTAAGSVNIGAWLERTRKGLLISSAESTGGRAELTGDVAAALAAVSRSLDHYYSLGYTVDHSGDGKTYTIEVRVPGHPAAQLAHRRAYVDRPAEVRAAQRLRSEMLFGRDANPLGVRLEVGEPESRFRLGASASKRVQVPVHVKIPFARLEMVPRGELWWGRVLITLLAEDGAGNQSELASQELEITVEDARHDEAVARGYFSFKTVLELEGGRQQVYVGIQDLLGSRTSIMPQRFGF